MRKAHTFQIVCGSKLSEKLIDDGLTVVVGLVRVRHQPAVVGPRRHRVGDPVVVVVIVALVSLPVFVRVQLRAVDYERAIILGVLMAVAIAAGGGGERHVQRGVSTNQSRGRKCHRDVKGGVCYLSWFVSHESPTRSLSMSD